MRQEEALPVSIPHGHLLRALNTRKWAADLSLSLLLVSQPPPPDAPLSPKMDGAIRYCIHQLERHIVYLQTHLDLSNTAKI